MSDIIRLTQICPTVDDWWNAYISSSLKPQTSTPDVFLENILGANTIDKTTGYKGECNNICRDGQSTQSSQYCVYMGNRLTSYPDELMSVWEDGFITKITGAQLATMTNANRNNVHVLIPSIANKFFVNTSTQYAPLPAPNFLCTYFSGGANSANGVTFDLPILPLINIKAVVNTFGGNIMTATVAYAKPSMIFWKKVTYNDINYLCPAYQITWDSTSATTPSTFRKIITDEDLYGLLDLCKTV
jgi:hypothetical protein